LLGLERRKKEDNIRNPFLLENLSLEGISLQTLKWSP
jgi:predicted nuclease of restriction endonuclease-like (RecB) superfamily